MASYRTLIAVLRRLRRDARSSTLTIGGVLDALGDSGFCLLALFLALPFLQPFVPLGPYSTAGALSFILLGAQLLWGCRVPVLPEPIRRIPIARPVLELVIGNAIRFLGWCRRHTRLRYPEWVRGRRGRLVAGGILLGAGCIMIVPFFGIPLNDFFPALAIFSLSLGELEQDGLMVLIALAWLTIGAIYCTALIITIALFGWQIFGLG